MTQRVIGLDVGTHAVRAAELRLGRNGAVTLAKFGQVALPKGVVSGGEVVDPARLADAIKRLWKEVRFTSRKVIVGVGNQRVIVRPAEVPAMGDGDLRSAVELQAKELIPMPLDEVVLDHQVLERFIDGNGEDMMRVLIVAAQKDIVRNLLTAVELAGLTPSLVDLIPFALLRSLADVTGFDDLESGRQTGEAIVSVGAGVTTVVVHERGVPKFVRMLMRGGESLTDKVSTDLGVPFDAAEGLKRQVSAGLSDGQAEEAAAILAENVERFVEEIKGSLDFHTRQSDAAPLSRIVLTGGGARVPGLVDGLADTLGIPAQLGAPFERVELAKTGLTEVQLREAEDLSAIAIGLALAGRPVDRGARRLTLLPREVNERNKARQQGILVTAACIAAISGLMFLWYQRKSEANDLRDQTAEQRNLISQRQAEVNELGYLRDIENEFDTRSLFVTSALSRDVAWAKLIQEVATVLPDDVWLDTFDGSAPADGTLPGRMTVAGKGASHTSSARWLLRIDALESVTGLWVPSSVIAPNPIDGEDVVSFGSDATLTDRAFSRRVERYLGEILPGAPEPLSLPDPAAAGNSENSDGSGSSETDTSGGGESAPEGGSSTLDDSSEEGGAS